jgi:hypothetical protein
MPSLLDLRRRIRAVKSTQQITKAMKMISASKLRRAQDRVMGARPFARQMARVLNSLASRVESSAHPLLMEPEPNPDAKILLIVVTADKGLCGAFNTNIIKAAGAFIASPPRIAEASGADGAPRSESGVRGQGPPDQKKWRWGWWAARGAIFSSAARSKSGWRNSGFSSA